MLFVNRLVHTLVHGSEGEPVDASCRTNAGFAASLICIGLNITLCLAKGIAGLLAGSVSLIADAFNNLSDASSNIVSLLEFRLASRPADGATLTATAATSTWPVCLSPSWFAPSAST